MRAILKKKTNNCFLFNNACLWHLQLNCNLFPTNSKPCQNSISKTCLHPFKFASLIEKIFRSFLYLVLLQILLSNSHRNKDMLEDCPVKRGTWGFAVLRCWCFFNAVMQWLKSKLAVLRWSQTLRCAMFVFFTLRCSVKWNYLRCWGFLFDFFQT